MFKSEQMQFLTRKRIIWTTLNLVGMVLYLYLAASLWVKPGEEGMPGGPGDAFYFFLLLVPILLGYFALNTVALIVILRRKSNAHKRISIWIWMIVAVMWIFIYAYSHSRTIRTIDAQYGAFEFAIATIC
jgi:hypothetical protein